MKAGQPESLDLAGTPASWAPPASLARAPVHAVDCELLGLGFQTSNTGEVPNIHFGGSVELSFFHQLGLK